MKKSSQSKRLRRLNAKEKEERKKKGSPKTDIAVDDKDKPKGKEKIVSTEEVTIKIKNPIVSWFILR